ncbi:MAG TPA: tetratricopeptide repeat protein, partial [Candidatus Binataceae bacterium]|nr:tetratricopeptide repeat protein [Candidatus Binataceae bacterium]
VRAQLLRRHGDAKGSEALLREFLAREPNNPQALGALGLTLAAQGRAADALDAYRRASAILPRQPDLHYWIALTLRQLGRIGEARDECRRALADDPGNAKFKSLLADLSRDGAPK